VYDNSEVRHIPPAFYFGLLFIALGTLRGLLQAIEDGIQNLRNLFSSPFPQISHIGETRPPLWMAIIGSVVVLTSLLATFWL
jgi:hypothetical protein